MEAALAAPKARTKVGGNVSSEYTQGRIDGIFEGLTLGKYLLDQWMMNAKTIEDLRVLEYEQGAYYHGRLLDLKARSTISFIEGGTVQDF